MSSELERRTAIIVALRCGREPKEIIDFFKFPKATVYSIAKSLKESEDIEEGFLPPEERLQTGSQVRKRSANFIDRLQTMINDDPSVPMSTLAVVMQTVVKPWMTQIAAGILITTSKMELPPTRPIWCKLVLRESRHVLVKEFWPPAALTSTLRLLLVGPAIIQAVANLSREQVVMPLGGSGTVWRLYCERRKLD
ncbi:Uncharacterized protein FKW44_014210 [Caligus rogercresseyi]|uniref:Uncharacterized protein n=1 Tax=Caligus rogercresseyi TaxID=217165 RepID=A0A7T8GYJ9_CALRO|nr:Uncharacterized protein FKW44_014210 [Caligus rogercresseyi]